MGAVAYRLCSFRHLRTGPPAGAVSLAAMLIAVGSVAVSPAAAASKPPIVSGHAVVMPAQGLPVGPPGSEGSAGGSGLIAAGPLGATPGAASIAACDGVPPQSLSSCNLTYHNGSVMRTNTTHLVFWAPSGYSFPSGYEALIERYLTDIAHDSGGSTSTDSVTAQYYDTVGGGSTTSRTVRPSAARSPTPTATRVPKRNARASRAARRRA